VQLPVLGLALARAVRLLQFLQRAHLAVPGLPHLPHGCVFKTMRDSSEISTFDVMPHVSRQSIAHKIQYLSSNTASLQTSQNKRDADLIATTAQDERHLIVCSDGC
jgi:hypothetical protein